MPHIVALATAVPPHRVEQPTVREAMARLCKGQPHLERLIPVFNRSGVEARYLVHQPEWYLQDRTFDERNGEFVKGGLELAVQAVSACLTKAKVTASQIDHLYFVTTTGLATPSLDALLVERLGLREDVRRSPLFGLGCAGGAGALVRASEVLRAFPQQHALVVSVELCSLVFSTRAQTPTDLIGVALFGDGAAAVLLGGDESVSTGAKIMGARSQIFSHAHHLMGWNFTSDGMRLVLSREIPTFVKTAVKPVVEKFVRDHALSLSELNHYVLHPGGPKVLATYRSEFGLSDSSVGDSRESMRQFGNLSSAAVLFMLHDLIARGVTRPGDKGLMLALGPGFAAEMLLLSW